MPAIVYLDVDDEITSAAARLRTLTDERIALVLPLGSRLATSRINFRLLAREAGAHDKTLEIVTGDASTRALAASAGLMTHPSVAAFEGRPEPGAGPQPGSAGPAAAAAAAAVGAAGAGAGHGPLQQPLGLGLDDSPTAVVPVASPPRALTPPKAAQPVPQVGRRRTARPTDRMIAVGVAIVVLLLAGGVAAYQLLPNATVTLVPAVDKIGPIQLSVTAQTGITQPDPTRLLLPARLFSFDLGVTDTFPATGVKIDETTASGVVTFTNCDINGEQRIKAGAIVATESGIKFRTLHDVTVKKAQLGLFQIDCKSSDVDVQALAPGTSGNVPANSIKVIPAGYATNTLFVTNGAATTGGTHTETKQIVQTDLDAAVAALTNKLTTSFDDKIAAAEGVPQGTRLFTETEVLGKATPSVDPKTLLNTLGDTFDLGLTAKGTVIGVDPGPVTTLADARLRSSVKDGFTIVEDSIDIEPGDPLVTGSTITFPVTASAVATRDLDVSALRARIHGLGLPQARTVLREYGNATITVWPDWVTTIPTNDDRLSFTITAPAEPSAAPGASTRPSPTPARSSVPTGTTGP